MGPLRNRLNVHINRATRSAQQCLSPCLVQVFDPISGLIYYLELPDDYNLGKWSAPASLMPYLKEQIKNAVNWKLVLPFRLRNMALS